MQDARAALIYTTLPNADRAREMGELLVREGLAACVNIIPHMQSIYIWQGELAQDEEVVLLAKTTSQLATALMKRMAALHPYEVPAILHLPVMDVHAPYLAWMRQAVCAKPAADETGE